MMTKRSFGHLWALLALMLAVHAANVRADSTPGADAFLLIPVSAREIGVGQATVATVDDATAFHWNPAGLGNVNRVSIATSYARMYSGLANYQTIAAGAPVGGDYRLGLAWVRLGVDDIPVYPSLADYGTVDDRYVKAREGALGYFNYGQNAFFLTMARQIDFTFDMGWQYLTLPMQIPVGITVKYLAAGTNVDSLSVSGSGLGLDIGTQSRFDLGRALDVPALGSLSLGLAIANIGNTRITWDTPTEREDKQAMALRYGVAYTQHVPRIRGLISAAMARTGHGTAWGIEYVLLEKLYLRTGHDVISDSGLSLGAGFGWRGLRFDYALQRHPLGSTHRVSLHFEN